MRETMKRILTSVITSLGFGSIGIGIVGLIVCLVFLLGFIVKVLWNWVVPDIFNLPEITFWQGVGLYLLGWLLFSHANVSKRGNE